jgi:hypothetical protein
MTFLFLRPNIVRNMLCNTLHLNFPLTGENQSQQSVTCLLILSLFKDRAVNSWDSVSWLIWWLLKNELEGMRKRAVVHTITQLAWDFKKPMTPRLGYPISCPSYEPEIHRVKSISALNPLATVDHRHWNNRYSCRIAIGIVTLSIACSFASGNRTCAQINKAKILEKWLPVFRR